MWVQDKKWCHQHINYLILNNPSPVGNIKSHYSYSSLTLLTLTANSSCSWINYCFVFFKFTLTGLMKMGIIRRIHSSWTFLHLARLQSKTSMYFIVLCEKSTVSVPLTALQTKRQQSISRLLEMQGLQHFAHLFNLRPFWCVVITSQSDHMWWKKTVDQHKTCLASVTIKKNCNYFLVDLQLTEAVCMSDRGCFEI